MKNENQIMPLHLKPKSFRFGSEILLILSILVLFQITTTANASPLPPLGDQTLTSKAMTVAQTAGLEGTPTAQRVVRMTLAEWLALNDGELGKDAAQFGLTADMPVFVLAIRGKVEWRGLGMRPPGQSSPESYDNITVAVDARTGNLIQVGAKRAGFPMPVPVP
ncbi:MAG: hypothetical protein C4294_19670 [Nitrospiraceae bacterium]